MGRVAPRFHVKRALGRLGRHAPDASPEPVLTWAVQYDCGGRTYAYRRTRAEMNALLAQRFQTGRPAPYRVGIVDSPMP